MTWPATTIDFTGEYGTGAPGESQANPSLADWAAHISAEVEALGAGALEADAAPELIRDTVGSALIAGSNITITPNDGGDTITIAATGGGASIAADSARVNTSETTTSGTATDLTTIGPAPAVTVGASGLLFVTLTAQMYNNTANAECYMQFALSGANTLAVSLDRSLFFTSAAVDAEALASASFLIEGLNPGATTATAKYFVSGGTGTFRRREISLVAF